MQTGQWPRWGQLLAVAVVLGAGRQTRGQQAEPWAILRGHTKGITSLAFAPDGRTLASASNDNTVRLWELLSGKERATLRGHHHGVSAVAFTPDGRLLASCDFDGVLRLWDASGRLRNSLKGRGGVAHCLSFSRDGAVLAVGGRRDQRGGEIQLWDVSAAKLQLVLRGQGRRVNSVAFSADSRVVVAADADGSVQLWEVASGKLRASLRENFASVWSVAIVSDRLLASGGSDRVVRLWDVRAGREWVALKAHSDSVTRIVPAPTGRVLASAGLDGRVRLWDTVTGKELVSLNLGKPVWGVGFNPNGKLLAAGDADGTIRLWSVLKLYGAPLR